MFRRRSIASTIVGFVAVVGWLSGCTQQQVSAPPPAPAAPTTTPAPTTVAPPTVAPTLVATATPEPPLPTAVATPIPPPSPTAAVALAVTSASASSDCTTLPIRGFGLVWQSHPEVQGLVGCPSGAEAAMAVVYEQFEHGWMVQVGATAQSQPGARMVDVLFSDTETVAQVPDTWVAGHDPVSTGQTPPAGRVAPQRAFGKVWREGSSLRIQQRLGWALWAERGAAGAWQPYQLGQMIWTPDPKQIFVIGDQGQAAGAPSAWRLYPDLFAG